MKAADVGGEVDDDGEQLCCAICLQSSDFVRLPCCETVGSTVRFCLDCVRLLCERGDSRCPKCRASIGVEGTTVVKTRPTRRCFVCQQNKEITEQVCPPCLHGLQHPFRYTCDRCSRIQQIPHPMYRYQETPTSFSTVTWACHQACGDYTHWRILSSELSRVQDPPDAWNQRNQLDLAIARVRGLRENNDA